MLSAKDSDFISGQAQRFVRAMSRSIGFSDLEALELITNERPISLDPIVVDDVESLPAVVVEALGKQYGSKYGVAYLIVRRERDADTSSVAPHPLFLISSQLNGAISLAHPLVHPLETHPDVERQFGRFDGTVKVYNIDKGNSTHYREQGETSEMFEMHHDGLGSAGTVESVVLYMDSAPLWGGFTYFQNICRLSLDLAKTDVDAFRSLFLPNALSVLRPRGKGAIQVTGPVLYVNDLGAPQSTFRRSSGEYVVTWRDDIAALARARGFLHKFSAPFSAGSSFVHLAAEGHCCIIRNGDIAHGRTPFVDEPARGDVRVLSRKWFMRTSGDAIYKHVPGIRADSAYAAQYPEFFGSSVIEGEWNYDANLGCNVRRQ
jgi:hypothetical protein